MQKCFLSIIQCKWVCLPVFNCAIYTSKLRCQEPCRTISGWNVSQNAFGSNNPDCELHSACMGMIVPDSLWCGMTIRMRNRTSFRASFVKADCSTTNTIYNVRSRLTVSPSCLSVLCPCPALSCPVSLSTAGSVVTTCGKRAWSFAGDAPLASRWSLQAQERQHEECYTRYADNFDPIDRSFVTCSPIASVTLLYCESELLCFSILHVYIFTGWRQLT